MAGDKGLSVGSEVPPAKETLPPDARFAAKGKGIHFFGWVNNGDFITVCRTKVMAYGRTGHVTTHGGFQEMKALWFAGHR